MLINFHNIIITKRARKRKQAVYGYQITRLMNKGSNLDAANNKPQIGQELSAPRVDLNKLRDDVGKGKYDALIKKVQKQIQHEKLEKIAAAKLKQKQELEFKQTETAYLKQLHEKTVSEEKHKVLFEQNQKKYLQEKAVLEKQIKDLQTKQKTLIEQLNTITENEKQLREKAITILQKKHEKIIEELTEKLDIYRKAYTEKSAEVNALNKSLTAATPSKYGTSTVDLEKARQLGYAQGLYDTINGAQKTAQNALQGVLKELEKDSSYYKGMDDNFVNMYKKLSYQLNMQVTSTSVTQNYSPGSITAATKTVPFKSTVNDSSRAEKMREYDDMQKFLRDAYNVLKKSDKYAAVRRLEEIKIRVERDVNASEHRDPELREAQEAVLTHVKLKMMSVDQPMGGSITNAAVDKYPYTSYAESMY